MTTFIPVMMLLMAITMFVWHLYSSNDIAVYISKRKLFVRIISIEFFFTLLVLIIDAILSLT